MNSEDLNSEQESKLLERTKEYLRSRLDQRVPDTMLSGAWEEFYRVYNDLIRRFVIASGVRGANVDDCIQDVWTEVATRLVDFEYSPERPGLRAWLYAVVRSKATNLFRRTTRRAAQSLSDAIDAGREPLSTDADPADRYELRWEVALLETFLVDLRNDVSELNFRVLTLRMIEEKSVADVATTLELTAEQVRYRHHRMLKKLRARAAVYTGQQFAASDD